MKELSSVPPHVVFKALDLGLSQIRQEILRCAKLGYGDDWKEQIVILTENPNYNLDQISDDVKYRIDFGNLSRFIFDTEILNNNESKSRLHGFITEVKAIRNKVCHFTPISDLDFENLFVSIDKILLAIGLERLDRSQCWDGRTIPVVVEQKANVLNLKTTTDIKSYFKVSERWLGKKMNITVQFQRGKHTDKTYRYNHDELFNVVKSHLLSLPAFVDHKEYSSSSNIPGWAVETGLVYEV